MNWRAWVIGVTLAITQPMVGQTPATGEFAPVAPAKPLPINADIPPLAFKPVPPPPEPLTNGVIVSQPLTETKPPPTVEIAIPERPKDTVVFRAEALVLWSRGQYLPPLVTGNNQGQVAALGNTGTQILLGGDRRNTPALPGMNLSYRVDSAVNPGVAGELRFFTTGTVNTSLSTSPLNPAEWPVLARPLFNPVTGAEDIVQIRTPAMMGDLQSYTNTRLEGSEFSFLFPISRTTDSIVQGRVGVRNLTLNEGLRVDQTSMFFDNNVFVKTLVSDQIHTTNELNCLLLGVKNTRDNGDFFFELDTRVSLGNSRQTVRRDGATQTSRDGVAQTPSDSGLFVRPSNRGQIERHVFAVMPEGEFRMGYHLGRGFRLYLGYNVIWMNDILRPGEQIDRAIELPALGTTATTNRPAPIIVGTDFLIQGLNVGFEYRY